MDIIKRFPDGLDADGTMDSAITAVEEGASPDDVANQLLDGLDDDEQEALHEAARVEDGLDPRGPGARLRAALEIADPRSVKWLPVYDPRAVMETLRERDDARALLRTALDRWAMFAGNHGDPVDGGDMVEWFVNEFASAARAALGLPAVAAEPGSEA